MAEPISIQQLKDASEDAISLADFINKPENVMIPRRLASDINSLQYYLDYMSSYAQRSYETYDEMVANAINLSENVSVFVTNDLDPAKNGIYTYNGTSFVKGDYQPENVAKDYVEAKLGGLQVFDGKVRAQDVSTTDGSTQDVKNTELLHNQAAYPFEGGYITIDSFELGATITQRNQALHHAADGKLYRWGGTLPKTVPYGSTPQETGGFSSSAWVEVSDNALRFELLTSGGVSKVSGAAKQVATTQALKATNWLKVGDTVMTDGYSLIGDGGGAMYKIMAEGELANDAFYVTLNSGHRAVMISPKPYKGQQIGLLSSNTGAQNSDAFAYASQVVSNLSFELSEVVAVGSKLSHSGNSLAIRGVLGGGFTANAYLNYLLETPESTKVSIHNVFVEGNGFIERGLHVKGDCVIKDCEFVNFASSTTSAFPLYINYEYSNGKRAFVSGNRVVNVGGFTGGGVTETKGVTRAVYARTPREVSSECYIDIDSNHFDRIFAREGDVIHIQGYADATTVDDVKSQVVISNNYIGKSNRRAIKVDCSKVAIRNNTIHTISRDDPEYDTEEGGASVIGIFGKKEMKSYRNVEILNNTIYNYGGIKTSINIFQASGVVVKGNTHYGYGSGFLTSAHDGSVDLFIESNTVYGYCDTYVSGGSNIVFRDNTFTPFEGSVQLNLIKSIARIPDRFVFSDNKILLSPTQASNFVSVLHFENTAATGTAMDMKGSLITNNEIAGVLVNPYVTRCLLVNFPTVSGLKPTNGVISGNRTPSYSVVTGNNLDLTGCYVGENVRMTSAYNSGAGVSGATSRRVNSNLKVGTIWFDTDIGKPIFWNGSEWVDASGVSA